MLTEMVSQSSSVSSSSTASDSGSCNSNDELWPTAKQRTSLSDHNNNDDDEDDTDTDSSLSTPVRPPRLVSDKSLGTTTLQQQQQQQQQQQPTESTITMTTTSTLIWNVGRWLLFVSMGVVTATGVSAFSIKLPFLLAPWAAQQTYRTAFYQYDALYSFFDNTAWTYGTDYGLGVVMTALSLWILCGLWSSITTRKMRWLSACLLWSYAISVTAGGIAHQFYFTIDDRNTWVFRGLWALCVGSVTAASGWMGCIGTELLRQLAKEEHWSSSSSSDDKTTIRFGRNMVPIVPEGFWIGFGMGATLICMLGYMSFQRPACDIFVAGTTQVVSSVYMMGVVGWSYRNHPYIRTSYRVTSVLSWILNAPLLPLYPLLIQYTDWSLASVNTFLHCWLLVAWGLQGCTMQHYSQALHKATSKPIKAIPLKKQKLMMTTTTTTITTTSVTAASKKEL